MTMKMKQINMKQIKENYKDEIDNIFNRFPEEDKKIIEDYMTKRRTTAGDEKCRQYKVKLIILRDISKVSFEEWNNPEIINNLLITIKNSKRNDKIELKKILKHFIDWKFNNPRLTKLVKCGTQKPNREKINKSNFPTDKEIEKMFLACEKLEEKAMFCLQEELGLRPQEVLNLRWKDIKFIEDSNHAIIQINGTKSINSVRTLPVKSSYIPLLRWRNEYIYSDRKPEDYVFPSGNRNEPHQRQYMDFLYTKLCDKAKIRHIYPYMLRHRRLTFVFEKTTDLLLTSKFGGHSIKISSDYYQHSSDADIKDMIMEKVYDVKEPTQEEKTQIEQLKTKFALTKETQDKIIEEFKNEVLKIKDSVNAGTQKTIKDLAEIKKFYSEDRKEITKKMYQEIGEKIIEEKYKQRKEIFDEVKKDFDIILKQKIKKEFTEIIKLNPKLNLPKS